MVLASLHKSQDFSAMFELHGTPYSINEIAGEKVRSQISEIEKRVSFLRNDGSLTEETLKHYYGKRRFELVAESNAIEGSTLSVGETELAVLKGITITGHDPGFSRDAIALDEALNRIVELARRKDRPTDIDQLHEVHNLIMGDRIGSGAFRRDRVMIRGSSHPPPKTWSEVMDGMERWQNWSIADSSIAAPMRSIVLHAWLTHIHPYLDGNGRTARAIGNLELIRAGYPPIIIKRVHRNRYLSVLADSDEAGDISSFAEFVLNLVVTALEGLERFAKEKEGFDPRLKQIQELQKKQFQVWKASVRLLSSMIEFNIAKHIEKVGGTCKVKSFHEEFDLEDYLTLCSGVAIPKSWVFQVAIEVPGFPDFEMLVYVGYRSSRIFSWLNRQGGPSLFWSRKNPENYPRWIDAESHSPFAVEMTTDAGNGDRWIVRKDDNSVNEISTTELAEKIVNAILDRIIPD